MAVLGAAYYNQNMMDELLPAVSPGTDIETVCGAFAAHWYDDGANDNINYYRNHIKGILIRSAGMYVPYSFLSNPRNFFEQRPFIPIIFFHGQKDHVFNINSTTLSYSPTSHTSFNSTTFCTDATNGSTFKVNGDGNPNIIEYGSKGIYDLLYKMHRKS